MRPVDECVAREVDRVKRATKCGSVEIADSDVGGVDEAIGRDVDAAHIDVQQESDCELARGAKCRCVDRNETGRVARHRLGGRRRAREIGEARRVHGAIGRAENAEEYGQQRLVVRRIQWRGERADPTPRRTKCDQRRDHP